MGVLSMQGAGRGAHAMDFLIFLVRDGWLTAEQGFALLELQQRQRPVLGKLALQRGRLRVSQISAILSTQATEAPPRRFGDIAISLGFLTPDTLDLLLREQASLTPSLDTLLQQSGWLSEDALARARQIFALRRQAA